MADDSRFRYRRGDNEQGATPGVPTSGAPMRGIPPRAVQQRPVQGVPPARPAATPRPSLSTPAPQLAPRPAYGTTPRPVEPAQRAYAPPPRPPQRPLQPPAPPRPVSAASLAAAPAAARAMRDLPPLAAPAGDDPLAELARLMGDQDPFADFGALEPEPARPAPQGTREQAYREAPASSDRPAPAASPRTAAAPAGGAVRSGYGSLARQAPPPPVDYDDDYDDEDEVPPARAPAAAAPQGRASSPRYDEAAYAYSAERNDADDDYDDYDDSYDPQFAGEGYMPPHGEELYEGEPRRRRGRTALLAAAGVLALAVAGTAGVYAYNMAIGSGPVLGLSGAPPVIRADATPAKTQTPPPAPATADVGQKLIYDRVGAPGAEKVVPREEQPVDVATAARAPADPPPSTGSIPPNPTEPKKVRTMTVRADNALASQFSSVTAYAPTQNPVPAGLPEPNPVSTVPLSGATQTAAVAPPVSESGSYVVQVASQRTESDAMGSWKALQARYPNLLGGYRASVKKADLGERGIYYRAQVGPFASSDQANELCRALKAQGGDCLVNKN